jgi:hypothetical protein
MDTGFASEIMLKREAVLVRETLTGCVARRHGGPKSREKTAR